MNPRGFSLWSSTFGEIVYCLQGNNQSSLITSENSPLTIQSNCSIDTVVQLIHYSGDTTKKFLHLFCNFVLSIKLSIVEKRRSSFLLTSTFQRIRGDPFQNRLIAVFWHSHFDSFSWKDASWWYRHFTESEETHCNCWLQLFLEFTEKVNNSQQIIVASLAKSIESLLHFWSTIAWWMPYQLRRPSKINFFVCLKATN